uniref:Putative secreted protein n=1 Tax=Panstrongylus lignarius TaxID=156445 RepID=A0A224Y4P6_9HEMI
MTYRRKFKNLKIMYNLLILLGLTRFKEHYQQLCNSYFTCFGSSLFIPSGRPIIQISCCHYKKGNSFLTKPFININISFSMYTK